MRSFQTDPCGVEARRSVASPTAHSRVSDGPLWGRSRCTRQGRGGHSGVSDGPLWGRSVCEVCGHNFETPVSDGPLWGRSYPRDVEAQHGRVGFRRTLVGSKLTLPSAGPAAVQRFQTDPCGVEAPVATGTATSATSFRRTFVDTTKQLQPRTSAGVRDELHLHRLATCASSVWIQG